MTDILGPADAPNFTTERPADDRTIGATDTWMKDCTAPNNNDGTKLKASLFNSFIANLRALVRGNGNTGGGPAVVAEDNADDMLLRGVSHLIQRGQTLYGVAAGTANALTVSLSPALAEYKAGLSLQVKALATNSAAATIKVNGLGEKSIVRMDGSPLLVGDSRAGSILPLVYDGTAFQLRSAIGAAALPFNTTIYVRTTGNDSNDGSANDDAHAFRTIQKAINHSLMYNLSGFDITIQIADGTYTAGAHCPTLNGSGRVYIIGNTPTPANVYVHAAGGDGFYVTGKNYIIRGLKVAVDTMTGGLGAGFRLEGGVVMLGNIEFGACAGPHILSDAGSLASISPTDSLTITGGGLAHMLANAGGVFDLTGCALNQTGTVTFSSAFAVAQRGGTIQGAYLSRAIGGTVNGPRYSANTNGIIESNGSSTYYPGSSAGSTSTGGQYV